jgi:hypothetical protein
VLLGEIEFPSHLIPNAHAATSTETQARAFVRRVSGVLSMGDQKTKRRIY